MNSAYRERLNEAKATAIDWKVKWMKVEGGWIKAESRNNIFNPNGPTALEGWIVTSVSYTVSAYATESAETPDGEPSWILFSTAKDDANCQYLKLKKKLRDFHTGGTP